MDYWRIPEYMDCGVSPEHMDCGVSPEYMDSGFSPEYMDDCFQTTVFYLTKFPTPGNYKPKMICWDRRLLKPKFRDTFHWAFSPKIGVFYAAIDCHCQNLIKNKSLFLHIHKSYGVFWRITRYWTQEILDRRNQVFKENRERSDCLPEIKQE